MEKDKYIQDLADIKTMMERSSRFLTLSGLTGVTIGFWALLTSWNVWEILQRIEGYQSDSMLVDLSTKVIIKFVLIGIITLAITIWTAVFQSKRLAKKRGEKLWTPAAKNMIITLTIPLTIGGLFAIVLLSNGLIGLIAPTTLIFYGLALINASNHTLSDIKYLGYSEVIIGLFAAYFFGYGLFFWAFGFGVLHIIYGIWMYLKYEKGA